MALLWSEIRVAFRALGRRPGFASIAILTLALGIASNTVVSSAVYAVFLAPLPFPDSSRVVLVWSQFRGGRRPTTPADYIEWKRSAAVFEELHAVSERTVNIVTDDQPDHVAAAPVTPGYLHMLRYGHPLALGRDFAPAEGLAGNDRVVILSNRFWRARFAADPNIIGRLVRIDGQPHEVVGVLGGGAGDSNENQVWLPLAFTPEQLDPRSSPFSLTVIGRLRRGVTIEQANAVMSTVNGALLGRRSGVLRELTVSVEPYRNSFLSTGVKRGLWLLLSAAVLVIAIGTVNIANLMLARGATRWREFAVRAALGASAPAIARHLVTEAVVLGAIAGALGAALAAGVLRILPRLLPPALLSTDVAITAALPVLLASVVLAILAGALSALPLVWRATRSNVFNSLRQGVASAEPASGRFLRGLVALEFALAMTLLTAGALALHGFMTLTCVDLGFAADNVLTFRVPISESELQTPRQVRGFYDELTRKLERIPNVSSVSVSTSIPLARGGLGRPFYVAGQPRQIPMDPFADFNAVAPDYLRTLRIRLVAGRTILPSDTAGTLPVALVNETLVRRHLGGQDPLRSMLVIPHILPGDAPPTELLQLHIVGVFADVRHAGAADDAVEEIVVPFDQAPWPSAAIAIRSNGDASILIRSVRGAVASLQPDLPIADVETLEARRRRMLSTDRFSLVVFGTVASVGLVLATFGVYALASYSVAQRTRDTGIRVALGASRTAVVLHMFRESFTSAAVGTIVGCGGAWVASRLLRGVVNGVADFTLAAQLAAGALLIGVAAVACLLPAVRAGRTSPGLALRDH